MFSLSPGENWVKLRERPPTADWQVFPQRAWNYALKVDEGSAAELIVREEPVADVPFGSGAPAVTISVAGRELDEWRAIDGVAPAPPLSPIGSSSKEERLTLIPYATAKLRITTFPSLLS